MRGLLSRLAGAPVACILLLAFPAPAHAHSSLQDAVPGPGDQVAPGTDVIALTLKGLSADSLPEVRVEGPGQSPVATGTPKLMGSTLCATVTPLRPGAHTISYTAVAADGDRQRNKFFFEVVEGAAAATVPALCGGLDLAAPAAEEVILGFDRATAVAVFAGAAFVVVTTTVSALRARSRRGISSDRRPSARHGPTGRRRAV